jgi:hypothetical protein
MTDPDDTISGLRTGLIEGLRAARATEREVFVALDAADRDAPPADGGWSAPEDDDLIAVRDEISTLIGE